MNVVHDWPYFKLSTYEQRGEKLSSTANKHLGIDIKQQFKKEHDSKGQ
mgnify:CR=1 FL=1